LTILAPPSGGPPRGPPGAPPGAPPSGRKYSSVDLFGSFGPRRPLTRMYVMQLLPEVPRQRRHEPVLRLVLLPEAHPERRKVRPLVRAHLHEDHLQQSLEVRPREFRHQEAVPARPQHHQELRLHHQQCQPKFLRRLLLLHLRSLVA
jgi:hypothetical protein